MATKQEKAEAIETLKTQFKLVPGDVIWTTLRGVARSGMTRWLDLYVIRDGEPLRLTWSAAHACGFTYDRKKEALKVGGCGMDMGFHVVSTLSRVLFPEGFGCIGYDPDNRESRCPSNDHSNGDRDYTPHTYGEPSAEKALGRHACPFCGSTVIEDAHCGPRTFADGTKQRSCQKCGIGWGQMNTHWHRSGDYAIRHRWL